MAPYSEDWPPRCVMHRETLVEMKSDIAEIKAELRAAHEVQAEAAKRQFEWRKLAVTVFVSFCLSGAGLAAIGRALGWIK